MINSDCVLFITISSYFFLTDLFDMAATTARGVGYTPPTPLAFMAANVEKIGKVLCVVVCVFTGPTVAIRVAWSVRSLVSFSSYSYNAPFTPSSAR